MKIRRLMPLLLIALLSPTLVGGCRNPETTGKGNGMVLKATIPPIDASAPTETETATFALG